MPVSVGVHAVRLPAAFVRVDALEVVAAVANAYRNGLMHLFESVIALFQVASRNGSTASSELACHVVVGHAERKNVNRHMLLAAVDCCVCEIMNFVHHRIGHGETSNR